MPNFQTLTNSKANDDTDDQVSKEEEDKRSSLLREIKSWERDFQVLFRRKPSRSDVCLDERVRKMYSEFKRFKSRAGTDGTDSNAAKTGSGRTSFVTATTITAAASSDDRKSNAKTKEVEERARDDDDDDDDVVEATPKKNEKKGIFNGTSTVAAAAAHNGSLERTVKVSSAAIIKSSGTTKRTTAASSFASIVQKRKNAANGGAYEPLMCEEDARNMAKERQGALKRQHMNVAANVSLTEALREEPEKKKRARDATVAASSADASIAKKKVVVVADAAVHRNKIEEDDDVMIVNDEKQMTTTTNGNTRKEELIVRETQTTTATKLTTVHEDVKVIPRVIKKAAAPKFRGVSEHSRRKTYKAPRRKAGSAKRAPSVYRGDAARAGGSKHLNAERRERNGKGKAGNFSVGDGDDDFGVFAKSGSKNGYDDDDDDAKNTLADTVNAEKRKKLEELNDETLQKYILDVREYLLKEKNDDDDDEIEKTLLESKLKLVLERAFGFREFKPGQIDVIRRVLNGENTLALLPTGAGKSLTYQLPALLLPGITLVISPLLALMSDQMRGLPPALKGACLRSDSSYEKAEKTLEEVKNGDVSILFVSPERLLNEKFLHAIRESPRGVSLACIDEAHCVSEWSHNFRPAYHRLGSILFHRVMGKHRTFPVLALTATATKKTEMSLREALSIRAENALRNDSIRDNLSLSVIRVPACARDSTLLHYLQIDHPKGAAIVYVAFQREAEHVASYLKIKGISARPYHAGLDKSDRHRTQVQFQENKIRVIVATVAFGMGLDKPDVRHVINYALPRSPEAYIQQCGRAGRDGNDAYCLTFLDPDDYLRSRSLTHADGCDFASIRDLMEAVFIGNGELPTTNKKKNNAADHWEKRENDYDDHGNWIPKLGRIRPEVIAPIIDVKLEAIETALSCLELWGRDAQSTSSSIIDEKEGHSNLLRVLPDFRSTCEIRFFGRDPKEIAKQSTLVDAILKLCPEPKADGARIFDVCKAAFLSNASLDDVAFQLKALRENREAGYEIRDRALGFEILRMPPSGDGLRKLVLDLTKRLDAVEKGSVGKLDALYKALDFAADAEEDEVQGFRLRESLKSYLNDDDDDIKEAVAVIVEKGSEELDGKIDRDVGAEEIEKNEDADIALRSKNLPACVLTEKRMLLADIREILSHRRGGKSGSAGMLRARAVARILHGVGSPKYPAAEWRRGASAHLWERHRDVDFYTILEKCDKEILRLRGI
jgi:ATP-dependent DNA helicase Q4